MDVYRSPNIGIFLKAGEKYVIVPEGLAETKASKLTSYLDVDEVRVSIAGSRLLGPFMAMNSSGIVVSRLAGDEEVSTLRKETGLKVERVPSRFTSIGNLVAANDHGVLVSEVLGEEAISVIGHTLSAPCRAISVASYLQVGSVISAANSGAVVHPKASEKEIDEISKTLGVDVEPATVNGGVPFVSSGILVNSRNAVVGNLATGPELVILSRAFRI